MSILVGRGQLVLNRSHIGLSCTSIIIVYSYWSTETHNYTLSNSHALICRSY